MRKPLFVLGLCALVPLVTAAPSAGGERGLLLFGIGWFNAGGARDPIQLDVEWRSVPKSWELRINAGVMVNGDGAAYGFGGVARELRFGQRWGASIGFGAGLWSTGSGLDLGGPLQFRSSVDLFIEPSPRSRIGLSFYHLSNADIYDQNPGSNSLVLVYGLRLE